MHERWEPQSDYIRRHWLAGIREGREEGRELVQRSLMALGTGRFGRPGARALAAVAEASLVTLTGWIAAVDQASSWDDLVRRG